MTKERPEIIASVPSPQTIWPPTEATDLKRNKHMSFDLPCNYTLLKTPIGEGSYSEVFECKNNISGIHYAGKRYTKKLMYGMEPMLQNEFEILRNVSIQHPHILTLVDYFETSKYIFLITELATGGELFHKLSIKGNLHEFEVVSITNQLLDAMIYLHANHIVHRDVKAENILFSNTHSNEVLLADFGLAKSLRQGKLSGKCGTLSYMAPEMFKGEYDHRVDMWALGVVVYFMLCGYMPFDCETDDETKQAILEGDFRFDPPEYWDNVTNDAKNFLTLCFRVDPNQRITCKEAISHSFLHPLNRSKSSLMLINKLRESLAPLTMNKSISGPLNKSSANLASLLNKSSSNLTNNRSMSSTNLSSVNSFLRTTGYGIGSSGTLSATLGGAQCESPNMISKFNTPLTSTNVSRAQSLEQMEQTVNLVAVTQTHKASFQI